MKLHPYDIALPDDSRNLHIIVGIIYHIVPVFRNSVIRMDEISVISLADAVAHGIFSILDQPVPAHVGDLATLIPGFVVFFSEADHAAADQTEAVPFPVFITLVEEHLHPEADTQNQSPLRGSFQKIFVHPVLLQIFISFSERTHSRKNQ